CERCCRHAQHDEREQQRTNETDMHCDSSCLTSLVCPVLLCCSGFRGLRGEIAGLQTLEVNLKGLSRTEVDLASRTRQKIERTILHQHCEDGHCEDRHREDRPKHAYHHTLQPEERARSGPELRSPFL